MVNLQEYWDTLNKHDWYWAMSDDSGTYKEGQQKEYHLKNIAAKSKEHKAMYEAFYNHYWTGSPWQTKQAPKPERPA